MFCIRLKSMGFTTGIEKYFSFVIWEENEIEI